MREFKYVVTDPKGIHARPAGELVKAVKAFSSDIKIAKGGKAMNCKAIFDKFLQLLTFYRKCDMIFTVFP